MGVAITSPVRRVGRGLAALVLGAGVIAPAGAGAHAYTVQPGDSLSSIGAANGVSAQALAGANGRALGATLPVGASLQIPAPSGAGAGQSAVHGGGVSLVAVPAGEGTAYLRADAAAAFAALRRASREELGIDLYPAGPQSGWRSYAQQLSLWRSAQAGRGPLAAPPATSAHESGTAVDLAEPGMREAIDTLGARYGWEKVEAPAEWWHVNYVGG